VSSYYSVLTYTHHSPHSPLTLTTHHLPLTTYRRYDVDHDFNMKATELRNLVEDMQPAGQPKPPDKELQVRA